MVYHIDIRDMKGGKIGAHEKEAGDEMWIIHIIILKLGNENLKDESVLMRAGGIGSEVEARFYMRLRCKKPSIVFFWLEWNKLTAR